MRLLLGLCLCFLLLGAVSCAYQTQLLQSPRSGFVPEIDETSTRGRITRITPPDMFVSWRFRVSPDGRSVIFSGRQVDASNDEPFQLYRLDMGSNTPVKITSGGENNCWDPSFTKDGQGIVYRVEDSARTSLLPAGASTGSGSFLKIRSDGAGAKTKVPGSGLNKDFYPQVSSQDRVAFITYDAASGKSLIWTSGLDGSALTQYREGDFPSWSPDGTRIVFGYQGDIWMINAIGTELTQLTATNDIVESLPSFSPDGQYVVFVSNESNGGAGRDANIWTIKTDGTAKTQVTELASWDSWPTWAPDGIYFLSGRAKGDKNIQRIWRIEQ